MPKNGHIRDMNSLKNFYVLKSSAGSGKTYALVKYYLQLALQSESPYYYKHILAITFTNAAAKEMKDRVIERLREFSDTKNLEESKKGLFNEIAANLGLQPHELEHRARQCLVHMLHNYGLIAISTIDSFTHKIVRSFARDLRLHPDFNIEMDTNAFSEKIVDACLDAIGSDDELTTYLQQFTLENYEDEKGMKVRAALEDVSRQLYNEDAKDVLPTLEHLSLQDFRALQQKLKKDIAIFDEKIKAPALAAIELIRSKNLEISDFTYGKSGAVSVFFKFANDNFEMGTRFTNPRSNTSRWWSKSGNKEVVARIQEIEEQLEAYCQTMVELFTSDEKKSVEVKRAAVKVVYSMGMLARLSKIAQQIKEEENTILINDFQTIINEIVNDSPAPFIYERVGERYNHILFDEFQDTSGMQWNNFLPLIENALSKGSFNLIVGDGKQAIYRWRNGKAEQFVSLPELLGTHPPERRQALQHNYEKGVLSANYRSAKHIISFNNSFFDFVQSDPTMSFIQKVYEDQAQEEKRDRIGYVEVKITSNKEGGVRDQFIQDIVSNVRSVLDQGYLPGDIAILTRKAGKEAGPIAKALLEVGIEVVTRESFLLSNSAKVKLIMAFIRFMCQPDHLYSNVSIWQNLCVLYPEKFELKKLVASYTIPHERTLLPDIQRFLEAFYPSALEIGLLRSPIEIAESIITCFELTKDPFVEFLMDHLTRLSTQKDLSLQQVTEWWEERQHTLYTSSQESNQKVNIMTIHKSKGLQFPVVIYPRFATKDPARTLWLDVDKEEMGIEKILYSQGKNKIEDGMTDGMIADVENTALDQINLCYVATTRPEEQLYIILEQDKNMDATSKLIASFAENKMTSNEGVYTMGEKQGPVAKKHEPLVTKEIDGSLKPNIHSVQLRYTFLKDKIISQQEQRLMGTIIHECLSMIKTPVDIPGAIQLILPKYPTIQQSQREEIAAELRRIVDHALLRKWFSSEVEMYNEQEIILPNGHPIRPDRIIISENEWEVIDFKTGAPDKKHHLQVKNYVLEVEKISGKKVKGYLVYTPTMTIEEVK
jgi:ATP-dependent exoDNAse (exonuclease V) beta subunit